MLVQETTGEKRGMASQPDESAHQLDEAHVVEPSQAEIEEWAARERQRRQAWLNGPTHEQKAEWARRERDRRLAELEGGRYRRLPSADATRMAQRYMREAQLVAEGAMSLLFKLSLSDAFDQLVRAGREWEEEFTSQPPRRRRVALDAAARDIEPGSRPARVPDEREVPSRPD
jgi:hypothetical protein